MSATPAESTGASAMGGLRGHNGWLVGTILAVPLAIVVLWQTLPMHDYIRDAVQWIDSTGRKGVLAFYVVYVLCALIGIPRTLFNIAAGVLFSFPVALAAVLAAAATAYVLTFTIARTFAKDWVLRRVATSPKVQHVLDLVDEEGFKLVFLIRMNPFIPGVLKGYGLGTTRIGFFKYFTASVLGFLPIAVAHVYLGWVGGAAMLEEGGDPTPLQQWLLYGGVVASVVLVGIVYAYARKVMNRRFGD